MKFAGIDVGTQTVKAVVLEGEKVLGRRLEVTEEESDTAARRVYQALLQDIGIQDSDVGSVFATGSGANDVSFADRKSSQQVCASRAARWLVSTARIAVDIGAGGCRAIKMKPDGTMEDFVDNSKCASGTGAFIEMGAKYLKVPIEEIGLLSSNSDGAAELSSTCAVFAESAIISAIHSGESRERIAAGIHRSAAERVIELIGRLGIVEDVLLIGGAAMNTGLVTAIENLAGVPVRVPEHPQFAVATGAAIHASMRSSSRIGNRIEREF